MHIPSFPSTRSLEDIHVSNAQVIVVALVALVLLGLYRSLLGLFNRLRNTDGKLLRRSSQHHDEKASQYIEGEPSAGNRQKTKSWKWSSGFGFGLQFESFPIALNSTHQLGLTPPALGSGVGVLNLKMGAPTMSNHGSPTVRSQARNASQLIQPKLAKSWYTQHAKSMRNQPASVPATIKRNTFETAAPVHQSVRPVSMAKMIMSRHTFRRPVNPRRAPLLPSSKRHDVIYAEDEERETFYDASSHSSSEQNSPSPVHDGAPSQNEVSTTSMV